MEATIPIVEKKKSALSTEEKRLKIAACVVNLKKGLKRLRRDDIDEAIALLLQYDLDLKFAGKRAIESLSVVEVNKGKKPTPSMNVATIDLKQQTNVPQIKAFIINDSDSRKSTAYPFNEEEMHLYLPAIEHGKIKPIGNVIIEDWMKNKHSNEMNFTSIYATVALGHIEKVLEPVINIGENVKYKNKNLKVTRIIDNEIYLERGWFWSRFSVSAKDVQVLEPTQVDHFRVDSWDA